MIYTCSHHNYQSNLYQTYAISGNRGHDANYHGDCYPQLAPKLSFWKIWHHNLGLIPEMINNQFYLESYYQQVLKHIDPEKIYHKLDNSVLLCYEEPHAFCHRHIVAAWLELSLNINVPEVIIINSQIREVSRPLYIKSMLTDIMLKDHPSLNLPQLNCEILVNRDHLLSPSFVPSALVATDNNDSNFHQFLEPTLKPLISQTVYPFYLQMKHDMEKQGLFIILDSGYRSYEYQQQILDSQIAKLGVTTAHRLVAPPGASEHQSGLAFDIALIRDGNYCADIKETDPEVIWLMENAHQYGFILRYPKDKEHITSYQFEPWHYRYVGTRLANLLTDLNLTMEEYYQDKKFYDQLYTHHVKQPTIIKKTKKP